MPNPVPGADGVLFFCIDNPVSIVYSFYTVKTEFGPYKSYNRTMPGRMLKGKLRPRRRMIGRPVRD